MLVRDGKYGAVVTVHGVNSSPVTVAPLASSAPNDQAILSFAYDDGHKRLGQSGTDLADNLRQWARQHPGLSLQIRTHCMGARVAIDAIHKLDQQGPLPERVKLDLVAPAAAGFAIANIAAPVPDAIAKYIHNTAPAKDMGTWCNSSETCKKPTFPGTSRPASSSPITTNSPNPTTPGSKNSSATSMPSASTCPDTTT